MNIPKTKSDLKKFIDDRVQEGLHLDYKSSLAISDKKRKDIAKDVSAFANSDGGLIIYGIVEEGHLPVSIDGGINHKQYSREWLEQVLVSNISPIIDGVEINQIPLSDGKSAYSVYVPKSSRGPHQERQERRYYKRYNFKSSPMEDYEITDIRNRTYINPPLISVDISFQNSVLVYIEITNIGDTPALDVSTKLPEDFIWRGQKDIPQFFKRPIKYFPPGKKFSFMYNTYQEIVNNDDIKSEFTILVTYTNPRIDQIISDEFYFNMYNYYDSRIEETDLHKLGKTIEKAFGGLSKKIEKLGKYTEELSNIAGPTGLSLSTTTLRNIKRLKEGEELFEKIDPMYCGYRVFKEVLGVDDDMAFRLDHYFGYEWKDSKLSDIEGLTNEQIKDIKKYFDIKNI